MAATAVRLRCFPLSSGLQYYNHILRANHRPFPPLFSPSSSCSQNFHFSSSSGSNGGGGWSRLPNSTNPSSPSWVGPIGAFISGRRSRVAADQQFPFKVVMEQLVGVTASVIGDMLTRPNFRLIELDFVFSTLTVASILNFLLMYLSTPPPFPLPPPHNLNSLGFSPIAPLATCSNPEPGFVTTNKAPPTLLNAGTWAIHMGVSSNLRYQGLNGIEFLLAKWVSPVGFKSSVVVLARLTGSQKSAVEEEKVVGEDEEK